MNTRELYPGAVLDVYVVKDTGPLRTLQRKRRALRDQLAALDDSLARGSEGGGWPCAWLCRWCADEEDGRAAADGPAADAEAISTPFRSAEEGEARRRVLGELADVEQRLVASHRAIASADTGCCYLVCFRTLRDASTAKQVVNTPVAGTKILSAPTPTDIHWSSLTPVRLPEQHHPSPHNFPHPPPPPTPAHALSH